MKFIQGKPAEAAQAVAAALQAALNDNKQVLWLVCGGSNIASEVKIMAKLRANCGDQLANLLVLPMDERYGAPGHADSNYKIMTDQGFDPAAAYFADVLINNLPLEQTTTKFGDLLTAAFTKADVVIGLFGMGADGHTAGIKPGSPAAADPGQPAVGYEAEDFIRLTLTPQMIRKVDQVFLLAYGEGKRTTLQKLKDKKISLAKMPAQVLKQVENSVAYNDQIEGESK